MKIKVWTIKRIIVALLLIVLICGWILPFTVGIVGSWNIFYFRKNIKITFIMFLLSILLIYLLLLVLMPRYYDCMQVVRGYMKYSYLKKCIKNEVFQEPVKFMDKKQKKELSHLWVSEKWLCVNGDSCLYLNNPVCIPRRLINFGIIQCGELAHKSKAMPYPFMETFVLTIHTINGYEISLGYITQEQRDSYERMLKKEIPEFFNVKSEMKFMSNKSLRQNFKKNIHGKDDFIKYIQSNQNIHQ